MPPPLAVPHNLHQKLLKHLACATSSLAAAKWHYSSILGAAVSSFRGNVRAIRMGSWFNANICGASKGQYIFFKQSVSADHQWSGAAKDLGVRESTANLTKTDQAAWYMIGLYLVASMPLCITVALLASGFNQNANSGCSVTFDYCLVSDFSAIKASFGTNSTLKWLWEGQTFM